MPSVIKSLKMSSRSGSKFSKGWIPGFHNRPWQDGPPVGWRRDHAEMERQLARRRGRRQTQKEHRHGEA